MAINIRNGWTAQSLSPTAPRTALPTITQLTPSTPAATPNSPLPPFLQAAINQPAGGGLSGYASPFADDISRYRRSMADEMFGGGGGGWSGNGSVNPASQANLDQLQHKRQVMEEELAIKNLERRNNAFAQERNLADMQRRRQSLGNALFYHNSPQQRLDNQMFDSIQQINHPEPNATSALFNSANLPASHGWGGPAMPGMNFTAGF